MKYKQTQSIKPAQYELMKQGKMGKTVSWKKHKMTIGGLYIFK